MIKIDYPNILDEIFYKMQSLHAKPIIIGGYIRDNILQFYSKGQDYSQKSGSSKDIDIEVYGLSSFSELEDILKEFGKINTVGKSFGVCKLNIENMDLDFSLPRLDNHISAGHRGFEISLKPDLDFKSAIQRRDFTINAIGFDVLEKKIIDPYNGISDLKNKILKAVDKTTFVEDPLRILRAVQFCARFDLDMDEELKTLCREMIESDLLVTLSKERIFEEIKKLLLKSNTPSVGFEILRQLGALKYFPELEAIIGVQQNPVYHPEGDVWTHTMLTLDAMTRLKTDDDKTNLVLMLAALCHDFGKAVTTKEKMGVITSISHETAGLIPAKNFIRRLSNQNELIERVLPLIQYHLMVTQLYEQKSKDSALLRLATKVNMQELLLLSRADFLGRTTEESKSGVYKAGDAIQKRVKNLDILHKKVPPLLQGRDIMACGISPSKEFSKILDSAYEAQMDGIFNSYEEGMIWLKNFLFAE
ncbi:HD domain-containing protein [bacterium]|nr:HD domain-containing protein [bacterium]MBU1989978.1 HD domain-containing protein [bacterium]